MNNRLYIIEGTPCSGKSTTSEFVSDFLRNDSKVCFIDEGSGNHPADYEFHALISEERIACFSQEEQERIKGCSERVQRGFVVPLVQFGGELFEQLLQYKIYDFLPWETEKPIMLDRWQKFCDSADNDTIYVFNCVLLQNPMCETMMRFGFSEKRSLDYISEIAEIIRPLNPAVIYLKNDDISENVKKAAGERGGWLESVIDYHVNGAYGKSIGAQGFDGYISCLEERQKRELRILSQLSAESLVVENAHRNWDAAYEKIKEYLSCMKLKRI